MKVYRHDDKMSHVSRQRHWIVSDHDAAHRFYDFRKNPELIPKVLEDFKPHAEQPAIQEFFSLLTNINGPQSSFETNDSAFRGPHPNTSTNVSKGAVQVSGRVMLYFRDLPLNTSRAYVEWLEIGVHYYLSQLTPELEDGVVGTSIMKMHMPELGTDDAPAQGFELCLHFWAWGDGDVGAWANLHTVITNIHRALAALTTDTEAKRYLLPLSDA
jgi:hypothetical protein